MNDLQMRIKLLKGRDIACKDCFWKDNGRCWIWEKNGLNKVVSNLQRLNKQKGDSIIYYKYDRILTKNKCPNHRQGVKNE